MALEPNAQFPGGSRNAVTRAGDAVRNGTATNADEDVIEVWRAAHRHVLNSFQAILRNRTRGMDVKIAQRNKRKRTIYDKLRRFPGMQLGRMDDVAGCRLIFPDIESLVDVRSKIHASRFHHRLRNHPEKYDYILHPKATGYRGIHDIYEYDVRSEAGRRFNGLYLELQYRTRVQHAWATTVEVIGNITENRPKFNQGDDRLINVMVMASEILARAFEGRKSALPDISDTDLVRAFVELGQELQLMETLRELDANAERQPTERQNLILVYGNTEDNAEILPYRDATEALRALFQLEKERPDADIVLVRGEGADVREAFQNYFNDARDFINYIDEGMRRLMHADDFGDHFLTVEEQVDLQIRDDIPPPEGAT